MVPSWQVIGPHPVRMMTAPRRRSTLSLVVVRTFDHPLYREGAVAPVQEDPSPTGDERAELDRLRAEISAPGARQTERVLSQPSERGASLRGGA
jgi:hypothetical protein